MATLVSCTPTCKDFPKWYRGWENTLPSAVTKLMRPEKGTQWSDTPQERNAFHTMDRQHGCIQSLHRSWPLSENELYSTIYTEGTTSIGAMIILLLCFLHKLLHTSATMVFTHVRSHTRWTPPSHAAHSFHGRFLPWHAQCRPSLIPHLLVHRTGSWMEHRPLSAPVR